MPAPQKITLGFYLINFCTGKDEVTTKQETSEEQHMLCFVLGYIGRESIGLW